MKTIPAIAFFIFCISCTPSSSNHENDTDTTSGVQIIPNDSVDKNMPVQPMDTSASNMPIVNPDTSKLQPK